MNVFRLAGDLSHLFAIIILLLKIWHTQSCAGLSGRTQLLFLITYVTRYLDLFVNFVSIYNTTMKIFFIISATATVYLIFRRFRSTYDKNHDTLRMEFLLLPCAVLALVLNHDFTALEVLWTFSIYLEAVAILPQLFMITKTGEAETITNHYLFALGMYRAFYILNWIYRYHEENFFDEIATVAGIVQTVCYCDFFYLYVTKGGFRRPTSSAPPNARQRWYTSVVASHLGPWAFRPGRTSKQMAALDSVSLTPLKLTPGQKGRGGTHAEDVAEATVPLLQDEEETSISVSCSDPNSSPLHEQADDTRGESPLDLPPNVT